MLGNTSYFGVESIEGENHDFNNQKNTFKHGYDFSYQFTPKLRLHLQFMETRVKYTASYDWKNSNIQQLNPPLSTVADLKYSNLSILLHFNFLKFNKFESYFNMGFTVTGLNGSSQSLTTFDDQSSQKFAFNSFSLWQNYQTGLGFQYRINKYSGLNLDLNYRFYNKGFDSFMSRKVNSLDLSLTYRLFFSWKCVLKRESWTPLPQCE